MRLSEIILRINIAIIMMGASLFGYWYYIDGTLIRVPLITYNDPMNLQVENEVYESGEALRVYVNYCKTRPAPVTVNWTLVDTIVRFYPSELFEGAVGCVGTAEDPSLQYILRLPPDLPDGTYYLQTTTRIHINPIKDIVNEYKTETFTVKN